MSKQFKKCFAGIFLSLICYSNVYGQPDFIQSTRTIFNEWKNQTLLERIYAHTDKADYLAGEILWYRIYTYDATSQFPVNISKVVYVEILDASNKPIWQGKNEIDSGAAKGSIQLPISLNSGAYTFRAYTNWMKNFGPQQFFHKAISVVNTIRASSPDSSPVKQKVIFYPEGGNLVAGLQSRVAFHITGQLGQYQTGYLLNSRNDTVLQFEPVYEGMGTFTFTPVPGETYRSIINGTESGLPNVEQKGYVMTVASSGKNVMVNVNTNAVDEAKKIYLFVHRHQQLKVSEVQTSDNGNASFLINEKDIPPGVSYFTIFNEDRQPVCERLWFSNPGKKPLFIKTDSNNYSRRNKVMLEVGMREVRSEGSISIAVYHVDSLARGDLDDDIVNHLWMTSEIGHVENPGRYFEEGMTASADLLMLTKGWRRFSMNNISSRSFKYVPEFNGHLIEAKITDPAGAPKANTFVYLSIPGTHLKLYPARSNHSGIVQFEVKELYGEAEIILQGDSSLNNNYKIEVLTPFFETFSQPITRKLKISDSKRLLNQSIGMQAANIYWEDSIRKILTPVMDTFPFYGRSSIRYRLDDYTRFTTMEEVLREYIREVNVIQRQDGLQMKMLDLAHKQFLEGPPLAVLDGVPVFDSQKIFSYDPLKVEYIEVVPKPYYFGPSLFSGIVRFNTYKGNHELLQLDPGSVVIDYQGLQLEREFYSPQYPTLQAKASRIPDLRSLLYWAPSINLHNTEEGERVSFYTSDQPGKYLIVVQGLLADGTPVSSYKTFEVK